MVTLPPALVLVAMFTLGTTQHAAADISASGVAVPSDGEAEFADGDVGPITDEENQPPLGVLALGLSGPSVAADVIDSMHDYRPDFARPPPTKADVYAHDIATDLLDPGAASSRDPRASLRSEVQRSAPSSSPRAFGPAGDPGATGLIIKTQKQNEHILGTGNHANRVKQGGPLSVWDRGVNVDAMTRNAWINGTHVPGRPGVRDFEVGAPIGVAPGGGAQTKIRVHMDQQGCIHGHRAGPENP